ncbi:hypothetical protein NLJ89_g3516 [Agrocybe chaxingu]|uniref:Protein-S-isoprenylcysteine O-methyltransferase n=1 Tax=Agrocybe chaxingu TaxID=84603 RepID=A0A9W8K5I1_9AGAR|nr:hypothetical protein NLJ89_g3516 [Agrocybe chaxingu]
MSLARAVLLLIHGYFHHRAYISPNPNPPPEECPKPAEKETAAFFNTMNKRIAFFNVSYSLVCALEVLMIATFNFPSLPFSHIVLTTFTSPNATCTANLQPTILFLIGVFFALQGDLLRLWCFRELGKHFTFILTIQKDHKLMTSGPYAYLRHPSYLGAIFGFIGEILCHLTRGSWFMECAGKGMSGPVLVALKLLLCVKVLNMAMACVMLLKRAEQEDRVLKQTFGKEWDEWAKRVSYKSIPGIY